MDLDDQIKIEHLLFFDRKCRICGEIKNLIDDFYLTRKDRGTFPSAYSYECKECTKDRISKNRRRDNLIDWSYPDW